jgi:hypothetical protein
LKASEAIRICQIAGQDERVRLVDLSEFNPTQEAYRTGRLTAMMFHAFLCGTTKRQQQ